MRSSCPARARGNLRVASGARECKGRVVTDGIWERDDYEHADDGIIDPEDQLSEDSMDQVLEQGYSPPERPLGLDKFGTTLAEERQGETLDQRLAEEEPDPAMQVDLVEGEPPVRAGEGGDVPDDIDYGSGDVPDDVFEDGVVDDGEVGDARAGRLVDPDAGGTGDTEKDLVGFDVGVGGTVALVGPNGTGKTTLLRIVTGDLEPHEGSIGRSGGLGVMRQFVGSVRDETTVRDLLVSVATPRVTAAAEALDESELAIMETDDEPTQLRYAQALADWADAGGYDAETLWDVCTTAALGTPFERCQYRAVRTLSGGEQKRLVLEALLRGPDEVLLLDEPDNYLDVPGKRWLEAALRDSPKTVLFVSHDRELLSRAARQIVTVEAGTVLVPGDGV